MIVNKDCLSYVIKLRLPAIPRVPEYPVLSVAASFESQVDILLSVAEQYGFTGQLYSAAKPAYIVLAKRVEFKVDTLFLKTKELLAGLSKLGKFSIVGNSLKQPATCTVEIMTKTYVILSLSFMLPFGQKEFKGFFSDFRGTFLLALRGFRSIKGLLRAYDREHKREVK